jgi:hypothetical protein
MVSWGKGQELPFLPVLFQSSTISVSQEVYKAFPSLDDYISYVHTYSSYYYVCTCLVVIVLSVHPITLP